MTSSYISGMGRCVPNKVMSNEDFVKAGIDTTDEWIVSRTGIKTRHICEDNETASDLGHKAAKAALIDSGLEPSDIDMVLVATSTPDYDGFPSTACVIQDKLEIPSGRPAFDVSAACTGFNYALTTAHYYLMGSNMSHILVIGTDALSKIVDWKDRSTCILFGDGAGAVVLSKSDTSGLLYTQLYANGAEADILNVIDTIKMDGRAVFKTAINKIVPAVQDCLSKSQLSIEDIDYIIPHQANQRIMDTLAQKLGISPEKIVSNIASYGNTSAASIPLALAELNEKTPIKPDQHVLFLGFGAGFTWGVTLLKWRQT